MAVFSYLATTAIWASVSASIGAAAAGAIIAAGQAVAWSLASAALFRPKTPRQTVMASITQTDQPRIRAYGRNLLGGVKAFSESENDRLRQIHVAHHGPVDSLIQFWLDGQPIEVDPVTGHNQRYRYLWFRDGTGQGGDYPDVRNAFPTLWTAEHRLQGQATFCTAWGDPSDGNFAKVFPKGAYTQVQVEIRGTRVADLTGHPVYSENAALCIRDLMTHADGWAIPAAKLDDDIWTTFTAICATSVTLATGGVEARYRLCGYYTLEDPLKEVTARMLASCDGQIYETADGKVGILGGAWSSPDVTITADDILSIDMADGFDPMETYNVLHGSFVSPAHAYQPVDVEALRDNAALAIEEERSDRLEVEMCPSGSQLQRLMRIKMAKDRRALIGTIRTNLVGMKARFPKGDGIHTIRVRASEFGLDDVFEVTSHVFSITDGFCEIGIASIEPAAYAWNPATDEKPLPPTYSSIETPNNTVPYPQGVVVSQVYLAINQGVQGVKLAVSVNEPGRDSLELRAQIAAGYVADVTSNAPEWVEMASSKLRAESGVLDDGETFTIRICWKGRTDWVSAGSITVTANPDVPNAPTDFSALASGGAVALDWINAPEDFFRTQIWRGRTSNFAQATVLRNVAGVAGQVSDYTDRPTAAGTYFYWAVTINDSAVPSAPAGPASVTIT